MSRNAIGNRAPGGLPQLLPKLDAVAAREGSSKAVLAPLLAGLRAYAVEIDAFTRRSWDSYLGLPALHRKTHMGGLDTVEATVLPTPITLGSAGAVGTPSIGYSPGDHEHPTTDLDWLLALASLEVDPEDGIPVSDVRMRRLLEGIYLELAAIEEMPPPVQKPMVLDTGTIVLPGPSSGVGIQVDVVNPTWPWRDIIGTIIPDPVAGPTRAAFRTGVNAYAFSNGDEVDYTFHMPHDYAPGTDLFIHVHWAHNAGVAVSGTVRFALTTSYAKGHNQQAFITPVTTTISYNLVNLATTPQYQHRIDEISLTSPVATATTFATSKLEVDGIIQGTLVATVPGAGALNGASPTNSIYIFTIDLHYQSTSTGTKNKAPNFYGNGT